jgi:hypothetical protein
MAGITLAQAESQLQLWLDASAALAESESYTIGSGTSTARQLKRSDASKVLKMIAFWQGQVDALATSGRGRFIQMVPR